EDLAHPRPHLDRFVAAYRKAGGVVDLELFNGEGQGFIMRKAGSPASNRAIEMIIEFVHKQIPLGGQEATMSAPRTEATMPRPVEPARKPKSSNGKAVSPYGYPFWDWVAREDPEYVAARQPLSKLSIGEGKALSIKYREMVIIGILAFRGTKDGVI